jgi:hypothetical protein
VNHFGQHFLGLSQFRDTLSLVILHFGSDGSPCGEIYLIRRRCHFSYFAF